MGSSAAFAWSSSGRAWTAAARRSHSWLRRLRSFSASGLVSASLVRLAYSRTFRAFCGQPASQGVRGAAAQKVSQVPPRCLPRHQGLTTRH
jgi:hypothetical protein